MSRLSTAPPISDVRQGDALFGLGITYGLMHEFPLSGLRGVGRLTAAFALADHAVLSLDVDAVRILWIEDAGPSAIPLIGTEDGRTSDVGDSRIALTYAPITLWSGLHVGGWLGIELPNSDESKGIGSNTTNALVGTILSLPRGRVTLTGRLGLGIIETPLRLFSQDDVLVYSLDALIEFTESVRLVVSAAGRTNPRGSVALGAEDVGVVRAGAEFGIGRWRLDAGLGWGFANRSPDWQVGGGVSWVRSGD
jgi:hypothetical protein